MTSDQMIRLQQDAEDRARSLNSPDIGYEVGYEAGFIDGCTISKDQAEQAAAAANAMLCQYARDGAVDIEVFNDGMDLEFAMVRAAFRAAGLVIEE